MAGHQLGIEAPCGQTRFGIELAGERLAQDVVLPQGRRAIADPRVQPHQRQVGRLIGRLIRDEPFQGVDRGIVLAPIFVQNRHGAQEAA